RRRDYSLNQIAIVFAIIDGYLREPGDHVRLDVALQYRLLRHAKRVFFQLFDRGAHGPARADQRTDAGSDNRVDLDSRFDQRTNDSDVCHSAHRTTAKHQYGVRGVAQAIGSGTLRKWSGDRETRHLSGLIKWRKCRA